MIINADLHLHSCLSPCGDLEMSPTQIAFYLHQKNIQLAALTDHNSALNCPAFAEACKKYGIATLFGMELQTLEEVHMLCLFSKLETALLFSKEIYEIMPDIKNIPEKMGDQVYVDENENILGEVDKYLVTSADISIDDSAKRVHQLGGIIIPAHADRSAFSLTSQLGFIPEGDWDAIELVRLPSQIADKSQIIDTHGYPLTTSSDAHYIEHIARRPFQLDLENNDLTNSDGTVNIPTILTSLAKLSTKN